MGLVQRRGLQHRAPKLRSSVEHSHEFFISQCYANVSHPMSRETRGRPTSQNPHGAGRDSASCADSLQAVCRERSAPQGGYPRSLANSHRRRIHARTRPPSLAAPPGARRGAPGCIGGRGDTRLAARDAAQRGEMHLGPGATSSCRGVLVNFKSNALLPCTTPTLYSRTPMHTNNS